MKILFAGVWDEDIENIDHLLRGQEHEFLLSETYESCLQKCEAHIPDVLVVGPHLDFEQTKYIFDSFDDLGEEIHHTQVLYLTDKNKNDAEIAKRFLYDEILQTPVEFDNFTHTIDELCRLSRLMQNIEQKEQMLTTLQEHVSKERRITECLNENLVCFGGFNAENISYHVPGDALFFGEVLTVSERNNGNQIVLIAKFPDSGLYASIGAYPMTDIVKKMSAKDFSLSQIVCEINNKLFDILPEDVTVTACVAEFDYENKSLHWWNCGMECCYLQDVNSQLTVLRASDQIPLGMVGNASFSLDLQTFPLEKNMVLHLSTNPDEITNQQDIVSGLSGVPKARESYSFLSLTATQERFEQLDYTPHSHALTDWQFRIDLQAHSLIEYDPLPMLMAILMEVRELRSHRGNVYTLLAELYTNALEHGLLNLDSKIKQSPNGFMQYLTKKKQRLKTLQDGKISFEFMHYLLPEGGSLVIAVEDSGNGFDHKKFATKQPDASEYSGRGLFLLKKICDSVNYNEKGNRIEIVYNWFYNQGSDEELL